MPWPQPRGQAILLFTDGLTEARDRNGQLYGSDRVRELALRQQGSRPKDMIEGCLKDLAAFRKDVPAGDDLTIMAIRRS